MFKKVTLSVVTALALLFSYIPVTHALTVQAVNEAGFDKLTDEQKADLIKQVAQKANTNVPAVPAVSKTTEVETWVSIGERIGKMMAGAAKEVGIAVNEFVQTPVGKMTAFLIVWNYIGSVVYHLVGGAIVFVVGMGLIAYMMRRGGSHTIEYDVDKRDIFGRSVKTVEQRTPLDGDDMFGFFIAFIVVVLISCVIGFTG